MVSPLGTQGQRAQPEKISDDGNELLYTSTGGFAGTENLPVLGAQYLARRGLPGWNTTPVSPSARDYPNLGYGNMVDYTDDLQRTLWMANTAQDAGTFRFTPFVREADGTISVVGPVIEDQDADASIVGTSADLKSVVINSRFRPTLTDGTVDTRGATRNSLIVSSRSEDGSINVRQVAYQAGATMFPTCPLTMGGPGTSGRGAISPDASRIIFSTTGTIPAACRGAAIRRVWARVGTADAFDLSASQCTVDCGAPQIALFEGASRDGSRVYFTTEQKLLDGDQDVTAGTKNDLYEYDFDRPGNKLVPVTVSADATGAGVVRVTRVSPDGSHVYFVANGRPLAGQNARGVEPQQGAQNLYVYHREPGQASGTTTFVGALDPADSDQWAPDVRRKAQTSHTGRYLLFSSAANLTQDRLPGDARQDLFRYDAQTDDLRRIWTNDPAHNGAARTDGAFMNEYAGSNVFAGGGVQKHWNRSRHMSEDGSTIMLDTAERLSDDDVNAEVDAYVWRVETGKLSMVSGGRSRVPARTSDMTPLGDSLVFITSDPLVKAHTSGSVATYVARKGGGFPDQPDPPEPCRGDGCQPPLQPPIPLPDLPNYVGPGNLIPDAERVAPTPRIDVRRPSAKQRRTAARSGRLDVPVTVNVGGKVTARATARLPRAKGRGRATRQVGKVSTTVKTGKRSLRLRISRTARATLRREGKLTVRITVRLAGAKSSKTVNVALRNSTKRSNG